jgi:hypothetical protein
LTTSVSDRQSEGVAALGGHEIEVHGMVLDVRAHEGAEGQHLDTFTAHLVQRRGDENAAQALALVPWIDLCVQERDRAGPRRYWTKPTSAPSTSTSKRSRSGTSRTAVTAVVMSLFTGPCDRRLSCDFHEDRNVPLVDAIAAMSFNVVAETTFDNVA